MKQSEAYPKSPEYSERVLGGLLEARIRRYYIEERQHAALGYPTPEESTARVEHFGSTPMHQPLPELP